MRALVVLKDPVKNQFLKKEGIEFAYSWKNTLSQRDLENIELVIAIGGDGTILSASHYLTKAPILAVNSSPKTSVGYLSTISINELDNKLNEIIKGKFKTESLERIELSINNKIQHPFALNEIFIANTKAYLISKYVLEYKNKKEEQRSSGLIFSTGTGSTAWFKSAGGKPFSP